MFKCLSVKLIKKHTCSCILRCSKWCSELLSQHLSRVKNLEDSLKPICMINNASLLVLDFSKVQDNKAIHRRLIKGYKESIKHQNNATLESSLEWWRSWLWRSNFRIFIFYTSNRAFHLSFASTHSEGT